MIATASDLGPVSAHVRDRVAALIDEWRVVVWYDSEQSFTRLLDRLALPGCTVVSAAGSALRARREAEIVYRQMSDGASANDERSLLIYVPAARGATPEAQQIDPFEVFARVGAAFGEGGSERLDSLARVALPERSDDIERLFRETRPTLKLLDGLRSGERAPLVRQALGTESAEEATLIVVARSDGPNRLASVAGAHNELKRMLEADLGFPDGPDAGPALRDRLARYLLVSELHFDLPGGLPSALEDVPHAGPSHRERVLAICNRWRETDEGREAYLVRAGESEHALRLTNVFGSTPPIGKLDTFRIQERARLKAIVDAVRDGNLGQAHALLAQANGSPWRREPERQTLWRAAQRCIEFQDHAALIESKVSNGKSRVRALVERYIAADGFWQVDRAQRLFEQAGAQCAQEDEVDSLLQASRQRYRSTIDPIQEAFQAAVTTEGWPPEGIRRHTEIFDAVVAPELEARRKTAFFLVDSLRYEMGRDLSEALVDLGSTSIEAAANVLPTTTLFGMAALMPGAHGAYEYKLDGNDVVPAVGGTILRNVEDRKGLLKRRFGDRYFDLRLDDVLTSAPKKLAHRVGAADLVVVRTQDIDALGEGFSLFRARKAMSDVLGELRTTAQRLIGLGFQTLIFAADHGHVLVPEVLPGDVLPTPSGEWRAKKRRSMLGQSHASAPGVLVLQAHQVGIVGPSEIADLAVSGGFKTFAGGAGYFHEGLSLQECIIPVVTLRATMPTGTPLSGPTGGEQVQIAYRSNRFTASIINLKLTLTAPSLFADSVPIRLEAVDTKDTKRVVGQAEECDAYDSRTGEVTLRPGDETSVPFAIDREFSGPRIDIRATDPRTGALLGRLTLKNGRLD